jgi:hypothetical protein
VERCATKGYGNAIVPQVAAEFIRALGIGTDATNAAGRRALEEK